MKYSGILFDLDGTLLDTLADIAAALNRALKKNGMPPRALDEVRAFVGNGSARLVELAVPAGSTDTAAAQVLADYRADYGENCNIKTAPYAGITTVIEHFKAEGLPMAVVSNKPDAEVKKLAAAHFPGLFTSAVGERENVRRKPAPDTVFTAMRELGIRADASVYVGDSEVDIATAKNAVVDCISVCWGFRERSVLAATGAKTIIDDPNELLDLI